MRRLRPWWLASSTPAAEETSKKASRTASPPAIRGSRKKLGEHFIQALHDDCVEHGVCGRQEAPTAYRQTVAALMPWPGSQSRAGAGEDAASRSGSQRSCGCCGPVQSARSLTWPAGGGSARRTVSSPIQRRSGFGAPSSPPEKTIDRWLARQAVPAPGRRCSRTLIAARKARG